MSVFRRRMMMAGSGAQDEYIQFEDAKVLSALLAAGIGDGIGVTYRQAAEYTGNFAGVFQNKNITSFMEAKYFTGVTTIASYAFNGNRIARMTWPPNVVTVLGGAFFYYNSNSKTANLYFDTWDEFARYLAINNFGSMANQSPLSATTFTDGHLIVGGVEISDFTWPHTRNGGSTINAATGLRVLRMPEGMTTLGQLPENMYLEDVYISSTISSYTYTGIGRRAPKLRFVLSSESDYMSVQDDALFNKAKTVLYKIPWGKTFADGLYVVPSTVQRLFYGCFQYCTGISSVRLPDGLLQLGQQCFLSSGVRTVVVPGTVTAIDYGALGTPITTAYFKASAPPATIGNNNFTTIQHIYVPTGCKDAYVAKAQFAAKADLIEELPLEDFPEY